MDGDVFMALVAVALPRPHADLDSPGEWRPRIPILSLISSAPIQQQLYHGLMPAMGSPVEWRRLRPILSLNSSAPIQ